MKKTTRSLLLSAMVLLCVSAGCSAAGGAATGKEKTALTFADVGWDSIKLNNALAGLVAEKVFGYTWQETPGSTPISHEALLKGEIDVHMEEWTGNIPSYAPDLRAGRFVELGVNFDDNRQGFYIPRYVADRYPDLKTVKDLARHAELFPDPEDASRGIVYGGIVGWEITEIMNRKIAAYGLDEHYNYFVSGSDAVLSAAMVSAWDRKAPIVAYYWEPTWLLGKYDFILLEDEPYDAARFQEGFGACPAVTVTVAASNEFAASNPEFCAFLARFGMPAAVISEALAYMNSSNAGYKEAAEWLLAKSHPELLDRWLSPEQAARMRAAL
ncbi:ABC transporter substrate-binding protein [uncultured Pyramidobacter sp.]|uniref:ABC transporter substrate-binding protein n=1 Tax=Pyramidobacter piscolens TaxID=638849 RepID=UPI0025861CC0|nr:ABC transporter substrate-binding protein [uncultured Pyramidobacter sp.]